MLQVLRKLFDAKAVDGKAVDGKPINSRLEELLIRNLLEDIEGIDSVLSSKVTILDLHRINLYC